MAVVVYTLSEEEQKLIFQTYFHTLGLCIYAVFSNL